MTDTEKCMDCVGTDEHQCGNSRMFRVMLIAVGILATLSLVLTLVVLMDVRAIEKQQDVMEYEIREIARTVRVPACVALDYGHASFRLDMLGKPADHQSVMKELAANTSDAYRNRLLYTPTWAGPHS